jgi:hypothetical protein
MESLAFTAAGRETLMLRLSQQQFATFETAATVRFARELVAFARRTMPARTERLNDEELQHIARLCLSAAHDFGVRWRNNVAKVFLIYLKYGQLILEEEEIREYLSGTSDPDRFFRHIFGSEFEGVWRKLDSRRSSLTSSGGPNGR